jgi:hypothetical protein
VTQKSFAIGGGALGQVVNESLDLLTTGIAEGSGSTVISGISFHEAGIELVLADQQAKAVAEAGLTVVAVVSGGRGWELLSRARTRRRWSPTEFLNRAETDAVGLAESAVDGTSFRDAHLGSADSQRDIGRIGVSVADKAARAGRLVHSGLKDPTLCGRIAELANRLDLDAETVIAAS